MMKMDSLTSGQEFNDFSAMFDKICSLTASTTTFNTQTTSINQPIQNTRRISNSVSPRITLKRGESQPNGVTASQRRLRFREFSQNSEDVIEVIGADSAFSNMHSVFLGFIHNPAVNDHSNSSNSDSSPVNQGNTSFSTQFNTFTREDYCLDKALSECNTIKQKDAFHDGILLKCIDAKPMFTYLHYSIFDAGSTTRINNLIRELDPSPKSQYSSYEELFVIHKSSSSPDTSLPSNRHSGFIISCFKLLEENFKQKNLEKNWLSWTGAREIYKYSPRSWLLRKITLHRHSYLNGRQRTFAYVLMCEFGNILHPSNTIQALDMCERLKARNCGHIALYQVQFNYGQPPIYAQPSIGHPTAGLSPWGSPGVSRTSPKPSRRQTRNPMLRGYSQDVETSSETTSRRRSALFRLRDHSFGFDLEEPPNTRYNNYSNNYDD